MASMLREGGGVAVPLPRQPLDREPDLSARGLDARACWLAIVVHLAARLLDLAVLFIVGVVSNESAYKSLVRWDASWYRRIAEHGYGFSHGVPDGRTLSDFAFFPLYPALERLVAGLFGLRIVDAGLVISAVGSVAAAAGIFMVGAWVFNARTGFVLVLLWSTLPISIVQSMAYTESLFTAFAAWTIYALLTRRFVLAGVLASCAGLTRPTGVAVAAAVIVAAVLELLTSRAGVKPRERWGRRIAGPVVSALLAPLGTIGYLAYVALREHDPFAYFAVAKGWGNGMDGGAAFLSWVSGLLRGRDPLMGLLVCGALVLLAVLLLELVRGGYPAPVLVFTFVAVLLALSTSGYLGSKPRYLLPVFPLLLPVAAWLSRASNARLVALGTGLAALSGVYGAIWLFGPGPP